jgi:hypothetical protein
MAIRRELGEGAENPVSARWRGAAMNKATFGLSPSRFPFGLSQSKPDKLPSTSFLRQASFDRLPSTGFLRQAQDERLSCIQGERFDHILPDQ